MDISGGDSSGTSRRGGIGISRRGVGCEIGVHMGGEDVESTGVGGGARGKQLLLVAATRIEREVGLLGRSGGVTLPLVVRKV